MKRILANIIFACLLLTACNGEQTASTSGGDNSNTTSCAIRGSSCNRGNGADGQTWLGLYKNYLVNASSGESSEFETAIKNANNSFTFQGGTNPNFTSFFDYVITYDSLGCRIFQISDLTATVVFLTLPSNGYGYAGLYNGTEYSICKINENTGASDCRFAEATPGDQMLYIRSTDHDVSFSGAAGLLSIGLTRGLFLFASQSENLTKTELSTGQATQAIGCTTWFTL